MSRLDKLLSTLLRGTSDASFAFDDLRYMLERIGFDEMTKYEVIIFWSDEDDVFIAEVPELPGCKAHGDSHEEALANAKDAMEFWIDRARELGRPVPEPKGRRRMYA